MHLGLTRALAIGLLVVPLTATSAAADELKLTIDAGRVTLQADNVPVRQILEEWARVGQTRMVNLEKLVGPGVTLRLEAVPEAQALAILLRSASGYLAAPRAVPEPGMSKFDRVLIMPTSRPPASPVNTFVAQPNEQLDQMSTAPTFDDPDFDDPEIEDPELDEEMMQAQPGVQGLYPANQMLNNPGVPGTVPPQFSPGIMPPQFPAGTVPPGQVFPAAPPPPLNFPDGTPDPELQQQQPAVPSSVPTAPRTMTRPGIVAPVSVPSGRVVAPQQPDPADPPPPDAR